METDAYIRHLAMVSAWLQGKPNPKELQILLAMAQRDGVDWKEIYEIAVRVRPKHWPAAPSLEEVDPTGVELPPIGAV